MLTLFTIPKRFKGEDARRQLNTIWSWVQLDQDVEILVYLDDADPPLEASSEYGYDNRISWRKVVERNEYGTPFLHAVFKDVAASARHSVIMYSNADIVYSKGDLASVIHHVSSANMIVGTRYNVQYDGTLYDHPYEELLALRNTAIARKETPHPAGSDYFIFRKEISPVLPPFVVGRPKWDEWMFLWARTHNVELVDASKTLIAVHQDHDYDHVAQRHGDKWNGPEADRHGELLGVDYRLNLHDAVYEIMNDKLRKKRSREVLNRRIATYAMLTRADDAPGSRPSLILALARTLRRIPLLPLRVKIMFVAKITRDVKMIAEAT